MGHTLSYHEVSKLAGHSGLRGIYPISSSVVGLEIVVRMGCNVSGSKYLDRGLVASFA